MGECSFLEDQWQPFAGHDLGQGQAHGRLSPSSSKEQLANFNINANVKY